MLKCEGVDWIYMVQDRDLWMSLVNMVKDLHHLSDCCLAKEGCCIQLAR
jgi:hypothetical protein